MKRHSFALLAFFAVALGLVPAGTCSGEEVAQPFVRLYDTGMPAADRLSDVAVAAREGWKQVVADDTTHRFSGDPAFGNERLTVVLRAKGRGVEVYSLLGGGAKHRADLVPVIKPGVAVEPATAFRIVESTSGAVAVEATFPGPATVTFRVAVGQPFVEVRPGAGMARLLVLAWPQWIVLPDFFGDDMAFSPEALGNKPPRLPAENCVLGLGGYGDAVTMCVWQGRSAEACTAVTRMDILMKPRLLGWQVGCAAGKSVWVAFLESTGLWHDSEAEGGAQGSPVNWQPPLAAKWRADRIGKDGFAESVTFETPLAAGRYIIYPIDRSKATPLTEFTPVDILRNTLGVGPCQYILETEGLASADNPTPDNVMTWVEKQLKKKGGKDAADEIRERLKAMAELVARTESRIKRYADLAAEMKQSFAADSSAIEIKATIDALTKAAADGLAATQPPGRVAKLADAVAAVIGKDTAAADLATPAAELRAIGAAQDRALAKSRMAVRWLGCRAPSPEITKRTDAFLQGK